MLTSKELTHTKHRLKDNCNHESKLTIWCTFHKPRLGLSVCQRILGALPFKIHRNFNICVLTEQAVQCKRSFQQQLFKIPQHAAKIYRLRFIFVRLDYFFLRLVVNNQVVMFVSSQIKCSKLGPIGQSSCVHEFLRSMNRLYQLIWISRSVAWAVASR